MIIIGEEGLNKLQKDYSKGKAVACTINKLQLLMMTPESSVIDATFGASF
jgi:hypothetical protein